MSQLTAQAENRYSFGSGLKRRRDDGYNQQTQL